MPYVVAATLFAWMFAYGRHARREGERLAAQAQAEADAQARAAAQGAPDPVAREARAAISVR
jgi:hypothetical protein